METMLDGLVFEVMIPLLLLGGFALVGGALFAAGLRLVCWWRGEKYESPFVW